jgi:hypothetical protein
MISKTETDFMLDDETMTAHLWAKDLKNMYDMMMLLLPDLNAGGYTTIRYLQDEKPDIFKED